MVCVSWHDAMAYARWLSGVLGEHYTLPTEAEWEYAARAGTQTAYWWGDPIGENHANCLDCGDRFSFTSPKTAFPANPFGLRDTAGNAWEWTLDGYASAYYANSPRENPQGPKDGAIRVIRGGSWSLVPDFIRSARRFGTPPSYRGDDLGFRLARTTQ